MSFEVLAAPPGVRNDAKVRRVNGVSVIADDQEDIVRFDDIPDDNFEDIFFNLECIDRANFCVAAPHHKLCLSDKHATRYVQCVLELLDDDNPDVVNSALKALGRLGSAAAKHVEVISKKRSDPRFRDQALETLAKLERHGTTHTDIVDVLKEHLPFTSDAENWDPYKIAAAIKALGHLGERVIVKRNLVPLIENLLADNSYFSFAFRSETVEMIGGLGSLAKPYVNKVANILGNTSDFSLNEKVLKALIQLEDNGREAFWTVFEYISYAFNMQLYGDVRRLCFEALRKIGMTVDDTKYLMDNMNENRSYVLQEIFDDVKSTIAAELDVHYVATLFKTTEDTENDSLRFLWGLKMLPLFEKDAKPFVGSVVEMLKHDKQQIRDAAVEAFEAIMLA